MKHIGLEENLSFEFFYLQRYYPYFRSRDYFAANRSHQQDGFRWQNLS